MAQEAGAMRWGRLGAFGLVALLALVSLLSIFLASAQAQETVTGVNPIPGFDHASEANFALTGKHAEVICESCHVDNQLAGTPRDCVSCHDGSRAAGKPAGHPPAGNDCSQCHTTSNFVPFAFSHTGITSGCVECHNGSRAPGKPADHPQVGNQCQECHTTRNFVPFAFDHTAIEEDCTSCHNGNRARGKPSDHIAAVGSCDDCHVSTGFAQVRLEHSVVVGECIDCHKPGAFYPPGQPADHPPVGDDCAACHSTFTFSNPILNHNVIDAPCATCHNNVVAIGKPVDHIPAPETCSDCHTPFFEQNFTAVNLDHDVVPGDCASCHFPGNDWGAPYKPASHPPGVSEDCESCHNTTFFGSGRTFDHMEVMGECIDCHFAGNPFDAPSMPHTGTSTSCEGCHDAFSGSFSFAMFDHDFTDPAAPCSTCHSTGSFFGSAPNPDDDADSRHGLISSTTCDDCHDETSFAPIAVATMSHAGFGGACATCHDAGDPFGDAPTTDDAPSSHDNVTSPSCDSCHDTGGFMPQVSFSHGLTNGMCSGCHTDTSQLDAATLPPGWHEAVSMDDCESCHATSGFTGASMDHTRSAGDAGACYTCHFTEGVDPDPTMATCRPHSEADEGACLSCHTATDPVGRPSCP